MTSAGSRITTYRERGRKLYASPAAVAAAVAAAAALDERAKPRKPDAVYLQPRKGKSLGFELIPTLGLTVGCTLGGIFFSLCLSFPKGSLARGEETVAPQMLRFARRKTALRSEW